jgi:hypothetical protein
MNSLLLHVASVILLVLAVVLGGLAFTRFGHDQVPDPSNPAYREFQAHRLQQARLSVALGIGASFALFGAFACNQVARRGPSPGP